MLPQLRDPRSASSSAYEASVAGSTLPPWQRILEEQPRANGAQLPAAGREDKAADHRMPLGSRTCRAAPRDGTAGQPVLPACLRGPAAPALTRSASQSWRRHVMMWSPSGRMTEQSQLGTVFVPKLGEDGLVSSVTSSADFAAAAAVESRRPEGQGDGKVTFCFVSRAFGPGDSAMDLDGEVRL
ncbi:hypothetical protein MPTK2_1g21350 [Marchantia polymorpha subsp. ruderalis]